MKRGGKKIKKRQITSIHNLAFYLWLEGEARQQIEASTFTSWKNKMVKQMKEKM